MNRCARTPFGMTVGSKPPPAAHLGGHGRGHADAGVRLDDGLLVAFGQHRAW